MEPYLGEIRLMAISFAPQGWMPCDGRLMSIRQWTALFSLLGTNYGGDGIQTFALPDLRGRVPVHNGAQTVGTAGGSEGVALTSGQVPAHTHQVAVFQNPGDKAGGLGHYIAGGVTAGTSPQNVNLYAAASANQVALDPATVSFAGTSAPHNNMQPYLALNYFIAAQGYYPPHP